MLPEGETFEVTASVKHRKRLSPEEILELAGRVYEGLSESEISEIESIAFGGTWFHRDDKS